jgi:AcrR family transcriptional regulator
VDSRPLRADARRNRDRIVAVATEVFADQGAGASLDEIARRAHVGPGTLYRHFPSREALQAAVYRDAVDDVCARGCDLVADPDADAALDAWIRLLVRHMIERRGLASALVSSLGKENEVFLDIHRALHDTGEALVSRARSLGAVRRDVDARDILWAAHGIALAADGPDGDARVERLLSVFRAGLSA